MNTISLPLIEHRRTEFGYPRTVCGCSDCTECCSQIPGYLVPADLDRLHCQLGNGEDLLEWARNHLLASPGALVARAGQLFRIPTLVPARQCNGACLFLTAEGRCSIHPVSPFGCGFFDTHMSSAEANVRSCTGLRSVLNAWLSEGTYARIWLDLAAEGLQAPAPEECRSPALTSPVQDRFMTVRHHGNHKPPGA